MDEPQMASRKVLLHGWDRAALLGQGIRLYDSPGRGPVRLDRVGAGAPTVNVRYRPAPS